MCTTYIYNTLYYLLKNLYRTLFFKKKYIFYFTTCLFSLTGPSLQIRRNGLTKTTKRVTNIYSFNYFLMKELPMFLVGLPMALKSIEMIKSSNIEAIKNLNVSVTWDKDFSSSPPRMLPTLNLKHNKINKPKRLRNLFFN